MSRGYLIPGVQSILQGKDGKAVDISEVLSIVMAIAAAHPDAKVHFWLKVGGGDEPGS